MPIQKIQRKKSIKYRVTINYTINGENKKYSVGIYDTLAEAKRNEHLASLEVSEKISQIQKEEIEKQSLERTLETVENVDHITWDELFEFYINYKKTQNIGLSQLSHIESRYKRYISPRIGNKEVLKTKKADLIELRNDITKLDMSSFYNNKTGHLKTRTVNTIMAMIKSMFELGMDAYEWKISKNPTDIKRLKEDEFESDYYTEEEFSKFLSVIDKPMDRLLFSLLFVTGLRIGEATALRFKDVIDKNGEFKIEFTRKHAKPHDGRNTLGEPKTKSSSRKVYLDEEIENMIIDYRDYLKEKNPVTFCDDWFIFSSKERGQKPIGFTTVARHKQQYADKVGLKYIRVHDFRGSYATNMTNYTSNIKVISMALGHSSTDITMKYYLKAREEDKKELAMKAGKNRKISLSI